MTSSRFERLGHFILISFRDPKVGVTRREGSV